MPKYKTETICVLENGNSKQRARGIAPPIEISESLQNLCFDVQFSEKIVLKSVLTSLYFGCTKKTISKRVQKLQPERGFEFLF